MSEEIIEVEQEFIDLAKAEMEKDPSLRPCKMCFHFETCHTRKGVQQYNYGGNCFVTNKQMLRAMLHEGIFLDEMKDGIRTQKAIYKDKTTGYLYVEDDLDWVEYYGG